MKKSIIYKFSLMILSLIIFLIFFELLIRIFFPQKLYDFPKGIFKSHPILGFVYTPNSKFEFKRRECNFEYKINSKSLRDVEHTYEKPKNCFRILGVGDSFTVGLCLKFEDIYLYQLENLLQNKLKSPKIEIIKAGVDSVGNNYELEYLKIEGLKYHPDIVIVGLYIGNDITDNLRNISEVSFIDGYRVESYKVNQSVKYFALKSFIKRNCHFLTFIIMRLNNIKVIRDFMVNRGWIENLYDQIEIFKKEKSNRLKIAWDKTDNILYQFSKLSREHNFKLLLLIIPSRFQVEQDRWEKIKNRLRISDNDFDIELPNKKLKQICKKYNILCLDSLPELIKQYKNGERVHYISDPHLSPEGHKIIANLLFDFIINNKLI